VSADTREEIAKSMSAVDDRRRKRGRPRKDKEPVRKVIQPDSFTGIRRQIERMVRNHQRAREMLNDLNDRRRQTPRSTYDLACDLADLGRRLHGDDRDVNSWCNSVSDAAYYPSDVSWKEALHVIHRLKAASLYLSMPYPDTISMTNPGAMAIDALEAIERFANK
jgi:hypothetical protein